MQINKIFGLDVSRFAATIATVNLAIRQLEFENNYPRVATKSFFRLEPGSELMQLPLSGSVGSEPVKSTVIIPQMQAVVGNPPYIRIHKLGADRQSEAMNVLGRGSRVRAPSKLPKSANYHVYFWFHGAQFLEQGGYLALLTSGEWLDSDYGAPLQDWLLRNFKIEAFIESGVEAWFSEARVGTVVTIAKQCSEATERDNNYVRFVTLRQTVRTLLGLHDNVREHINAVDSLRDRILGLAGHGESDEMDWSAVRQSDLRALGSKH